MLLSGGVKILLLVVGRDGKFLEVLVELVVLGLKPCLVALGLTVASSPVLALLFKLSQIVLKTAVLVVEASNLGVELFDRSSESLLGCFEGRSLALFILSVTNHGVDLNHILFVLLLLGLQLRLFDVKLDGKLVGLLGNFSLGGLSISKLFRLGGDLLLEGFLLVDHLLDIVVSAN